MGRELQKKKNKSSISKVRHKPKSKKVPIKGNAVVARNWYFFPHYFSCEPYGFLLGNLFRKNARVEGD